MRHHGGIGAGHRSFGGSAARRIPTRFARRIEALQALSPEERHALGAVLAPAAVVAPSTDLMVEGDSLTYGYVVEEGWACGYRLLNDGRRQILNFVLPGDCVGASAAVIRMADHSVCTLTPCRVYPFSAPRLAELQRGYPQLGQAFAWSARRELAMLQERLVGLGRRTARERVAHLILELLHRLRLVGLADGTAFELPLTQGALGDALGLSIVHVNRTLRRLNNEGVIRYRPGVVAAIDLPALARIAEFDEDYLHQAGSPPPTNGAATG